MKCPNCGAEMKEGTLYCEHCGEDIHIVPDFEPEIEYNMEQTLHDIAREMTPEEDATDDQDAQQSMTELQDYTTNCYLYEFQVGDKTYDGNSLVEEGDYRKIGTRVQVLYLDWYPSFNRPTYYWDD